MHGVQHAGSCVGSVLCLPQPAALNLGIQFSLTSGATRKLLWPRIVGAGRRVAGCNDRFASLLSLPARSPQGRCGQAINWQRKEEGQREQAGTKSRTIRSANCFTFGECAAATARPFVRNSGESCAQEGGPFYIFHLDVKNP